MQQIQVFIKKFTWPMWMNIVDPQSHRILIIDDTSTNLTRVSDYLSQAGFQTFMETSGAGGIKLAQQLLPDLILLETQLSDSDGFEVCRRLKADKKTRPIPVIFMTEMTQTECKSKGFAAGGVDFLSRPFQIEELIARVGSYIRIRELTEHCEDSKASLERRVTERTAELAQANEDLKQEIAEREMTRAALVRSEYEYRNLADNSPDNIIRYDQQCRAIYMNSAMAATLGAEPEKLIGKTPVQMEFAGQEVSAEYQRQLSQALESGESNQMELAMPHPSGEIRTHLILITPELDREGNISGVLAIGRDITAFKRAEQERVAYADFLSSLDRINRSIQSAGGLDEMMRNVLDEVLDIFQCDRAFLLYPCDPNASSWSIPMESTRPEYPGAGALGIDIPMDSEMSNTLNAILSNPGAVKFGPQEDYPLPQQVASQFGFKSMMSMAIYPKLGAVWDFGIHQCSSQRSWSYEEEKLFREIGRRLGDALTSLLILRDLRASEEQYRRIFETTREGILILDQNQNLKFINTQLTEMLGYTIDELQGHTVTDFMPDDELDDHRQRMNRREGNLAETYERRLIRKDGSLIWVLVSASPIFDGARYQGALSMISDISELKLAEQERQARADFFVNLDRINRAIQSTDDLDTMMSNVLSEVLDIFDCDRAVLVYPCDPTAPFWSSPMEKTRPEYPGLGISGQEIPWDEGVAAMFELQLKTPVALKYGAGSEHSLPSMNNADKFGIRSFMSVALYPKVGAAWQFALHQCSHERIWSEAEELLLQEIGRRLTDALSSLLILRDLSKSEAKYRRIFETASEGIWEQDENYTTVFVNSIMAEMMGYTIDELSNHLVTDFMLEEDRLDHIAKTADREKGLSDIYERRFIRKDGSILWTLLSAMPVIEAGQFKGSFAMMTDITQRKLDEQALERLNRELRALSDCNQVLVRAQDEQQLLDDVCRIINQEAGYSLVWVGFAQNDPALSIRPVAWAGEGVSFDTIQQLQLSWADTEIGHGPSVTALRSGKIARVNDFATEPNAIAWHEVAARFGFRSAIALPLKDENQKTLGVLTIYALDENAFTLEEQRLLSELADDLAFGVNTLRRRIEHDQAEEQIRIAATAFEAQEGIIITDTQNKILRVNAAFSQITGYSANEAVGSTPRMLNSGRHESAYFVNMWKCIQRDGVWQGEIWNRRKNGDIYPAWSNISVVRNPAGEITHYVGTMIDITERKAAEAKIEHLAYHDSLTQLPNRRLLLDRLEQALEASARSQHCGALLFVDLDNFKILNDTRGHNAGDQLLIEVAQRLLSCVRKEDTIARVGGDEFMIMLGDLGLDTQTGIRQSKLVGEKIMSTLSQPYSLEGHTHHITPSVGITLFSDNQGSVQDLMKQADIAMYQAKSSGRNTLRYYDPEMQAELAHRAALETELRQGIELQQFQAYYQPQIDNRLGIIGAEVLLRWNHPERGLVGPVEFIPLAEETGLILNIGQWVLETACAQLRIWADDPLKRELTLAVNVSQYQFRQDDFVEQVISVLERSAAPASRLKIELTESLLIDCMEDSIKKMYALKQLGVEFSLDDFGTGYSSLSYLTRLPLKQLKIDRSFISQLPQNHQDAVIAQTIITMARSLEMSVIAEGVETEAQRQFLEQHGCSAFQGYLFSRPITLEEFEVLFAHQPVLLPQ